MNRRYSQLRLVAVVLGAVLLAACSASTGTTQVSESASSQSSVSSTAVPEVPFHSPVMPAIRSVLAKGSIMDAYDTAYFRFTETYDIGDGVSIAAVRADCPYLDRAVHTFGQPYAKSGSTQLKANGKVLFDATYDLTAYECDYPHPAAYLHPTTAKIDQTARRGDNALQNILRIVTATP
jgi:hypothetical protein